MGIVPETGNWVKWRMMRIKEMETKRWKSLVVNENCKWMAIKKENGR